MKHIIPNKCGFTLIELLIVMSLLLLTTVTLYQFYHESYLNHGTALRVKTARLQKIRVFMAYLEADLQKYGTAAEVHESRVAMELRLPAEGTAAVIYRLGRDGQVSRNGQGEKLGLLDEIKTVSIQPYGGHPGLYRLRLTYFSQTDTKTSLEDVERVIGFPKVRKEG